MQSATVIAVACAAFVHFHCLSLLDTVAWAKLPEKYSYSGGFSISTICLQSKHNSTAWETNVYSTPLDAALIWKSTWCSAFQPPISLSLSLYFFPSFIHFISAQHKHFGGSTEMRNTLPDFRQQTVNKKKTTMSKISNSMTSPVILLNTTGAIRARSFASYAKSIQMKHLLSLSNERFYCFDLLQIFNSIPNVCTNTVFKWRSFLYRFSHLFARFISSCFMPISLWLIFLRNWQIHVINW